MFAGYTCTEGSGQPELYNDPSRLLRSVKRMASSEYSPITAVQATAEIAARLRGIIDLHGPRSVALYLDTYAYLNHPATPLVANGFMDAIGSQIRFTPASIDQPGKGIATGVHGAWMVPVQKFDDIEALVLIGTNPLVSLIGVPGRQPWHLFKDSFRRGGKLENGEYLFGVTLQLPSPDAVEIAGYTGLDYVWIDAEHGTLDVGDINDIVRAADGCGIDALVRVPDHSSSFIQRVLDTGAAGIIVPHVRTTAEAIAIVRATRFGPNWTRGACPSARAVDHAAPDWPTVYRQLDEAVLVFDLIEDAEGVENIDTITREASLDGIVFRPFDLAQESGLDGNVRHPEI